MAASKRDEVAGGNDAWAADQSSFDAVAQRELAITDIGLASIAQCSKAVIEPNGYVVHTPDGGLAGGHAQPGHGRLILGIAEQVRVAINQSGDDSVFGQVDEFYAGRRGGDDARYAIFFDDDICVVSYAAGAYVDEAPRQDGDSRGRIGFLWR